MTIFNTSIDPLTPTAIEPSFKIDKESLANYCDTIITNANSCNSYYQSRSSNDTYSSHNDVYSSYADTLNKIFTTASSFDSNTQLTLLQTLQHTLCQQRDGDHFGETFMKNYDATLQGILTRLLTTRNAPLESSRHMKRVALELLTSVLGVCRPYEALSWATETLFDLDWPDHPNQQARTDTAVLFVSAIECYGRSVLENSGSALSDEYIDSLLSPCNHALSFIDDTLKKKPPHDDNPSNTTTLLAIIDAILDLVSFCYSLSVTDSNILEGDMESTHIARANYLLVLVFDKFVLNCDLGLSHLFYQQYHSTYTVKRPHEEKTKPSINNWSKDITARIYRCMELAKQNGVVFDKLLSFKQLSHDTKLTFSDDGIMSILALSIYERYLDDNTTQQYLLSMLIEPKWVGRHCLGRIMNLLRNPQDTSKIDKAMLILLYLADIVDDGELKVTLDQLDQEFDGLDDGSQQKMTLAKAFQIMTSVTSMTDDSKLRFLGHQLIARFIQLGTDDTQLFILTELLSNCPFPTMHTAAIGLLKNQVDHAFRSLQHIPPTNRSVFCTKLLPDTFFPTIYENQVDPTCDDDVDDSGFWEKYNYHMQALNFYYYLIMRDKADNHTGVWDDDHRKWMNTTYFGPLEQLCAALNRTYQQTQSDSAANDHFGKMMQLDLLADMIKRIAAVSR